LLTYQEALVSSSVDEGGPVAGDGSGSRTDELTDSGEKPENVTAEMEGGREGGREGGGVGGVIVAGSTS